MFFFWGDIVGVKGVVFNVLKVFGLGVENTFTGDRVVVVSEGRRASGRSMVRVML